MRKLELRPQAPELPDRSEFLERPFDEIHLRDYFYALTNRYGYIRFGGLPIGRDTGAPIKIERLYVEPLLSDQRVVPEDIDGQGVKSPLNSVISALRSHQRLIILGDPGAGKSTLIHWLVNIFSSPEPHPLITNFGRLVPFPLVLRDLPWHLSNGSLSWPDLIASFLALPISHSLKSAPKRLTDTLFRTGQALILIDGLDEVPHGSRSALRQAVWDGFQAHNRCRWLLTSRIVGYDQCPFHAQFDASQEESTQTNSTSTPYSRIPPNINRLKHVSAYAHVQYTAPFDDSQLSTFAHNWYRHYEPSVDLADRSASEFLEAVRRNHGTRALARIPNLTTLMALIYRQYARLPDGRAVLYSKITEAYLESIDDARRLRFHSASTLSRSLKERWLSEVAFEMQSRRVRSITSGRRNSEPEGLLIAQDRLLQSLTFFIVHNTYLTDEQKARQEAANLLSVIAERSGLLCPRGSEERFAFIHLSFQEYFAAMHLRRAILARGWEVRNDPLLGPKALRNAAGDEIWTESILLLFELLGEHEGWSEHVARLLFKYELAWAGRRPKGITFLPMSVLVAISLDTQTGLGASFRRTIWTAAWKALLLCGCFGKPCQGDPGGTLMRQSEYREEILDHGRKLVASGEIKELGLSEAMRFPELLSLIVPGPIQTLHVLGWTMTRELRNAILALPSLESLSITASNQSEQLLNGLTNLTRLTIECPNSRPGDEVWSILSKISTLESLSIHRADHLETLSFLQFHSVLKELSIMFAPKLSNIGALRTLPRLTNVILAVETELDLSPLCDIPTLMSVVLYNSREPIELAPIAGKVDIYLRSGDRQWSETPWGREAITAPPRKRNPHQ